MMSIFSIIFICLTVNKKARSNMTNKRMTRVTVSIFAIIILLTSSIPIIYADPGPTNWNVAKAGFAEFHYITIDPDGPGPVPEGWLEVDFYHVVNSNTGNNYDVVQYVVWAGGFLPIAILTLVENQGAYEMLSNALSPLPVVDLSATPDLITIKAKGSKITAYIPPYLTDPLPAGEITFEKVKHGEKKTISTVMPLYQGVATFPETAEYLLTQSYDIKEATASFDSGLETSEAWITSKASTIISKIEESQAAYLTGLITAWYGTNDLATMTTDKKVAKHLNKAQEDMFEAITKEQLGETQSSFKKVESAVRDLEKVLEDVPIAEGIIVLLYGSVYVTVVPMGESLSGDKQERFYKTISEADEKYGEGEFSKAIGKLTKAYKTASNG